MSSAYIYYLFSSLQETLTLKNIEVGMGIANWKGSVGLACQRVGLYGYTWFSLVL